MADKLVMLALSPTMETAMISSWLKKEGDTVQTGDILCEVETDKATMDYESIVDGTLLKIVVPEGAEAAVGDLIAVVGEEGEDISDLLKEAAAASKSGAEKTAAAEAEKTTGDGQAPAAVRADGGEAAAVTKTGEDLETPAPSGGFIRSSPLARKLAGQYDLDLAGIEGSGPAGRIIKADVEKAKVTGVRKPAAAAASIRIPAGGEDIIIPHNNVRRIVAERLSESKFSAPHYYLKLSVETDRLMEARRTLNQTAAEKVSVNAFLIKFAAEALKRHPRVNAGWNDDSIIQFGRIDIGLAVAQEDGLITPVIRDAANKGIVQIDRELTALVEKAQNNRLMPEEYTGATFTISSLGSFGIDDFTAIINPPGSAILAVGAIKKEVVVTADDELEIRQMMRLSLSCDHRTIDGAVGAAFLYDLKQIIESPIRALY